MFLGSNTIASGAAASAAYRSQSAAPSIQEVSVSAPTTSALAATLSGLSDARQTDISVAVSRRFTQSRSGAGTNATPSASNRMTII